LPKSEENIQEAQAAFHAASAQIAEFDAKMDKLESSDHLKAGLRKIRFQKEMRTNKSELNEYSNKSKLV